VLSSLVDDRGIVPKLDNKAYLAGTAFKEVDMWCPVWVQTVRTWYSLLPFLGVTAIQCPVQCQVSTFTMRAISWESFSRTLVALVRGLVDLVIRKDLFGKLWITLPGDKHVLIKGVILNIIHLTSPTQLFSTLF
jgi:hypothetical protein